jgi:hypothetical protein
MNQERAVNQKKKTATEIFDPTADITGKTNMMIARELPKESVLGSIVVPTLPLEQRRRVARSLLGEHCRDDTVQMLVAISGHVAVQQEDILRARIAIGGHFLAVQQFIKKDVLSGGDMSETRQKLAKQLTYDYILAVHGYKRAMARNHILVYEEFAKNDEAIRILSYSEMLLMAEHVKSEDDRVMLLDEKQENGMTQLEFKARVREYAFKLKHANEQIEQLSSEVAQSEGDLYVKRAENIRLQSSNAELQRSLEDAHKKSQAIEANRAELSSRLVAARQDVDSARERSDALENEIRKLRAELDTGRVNSGGPSAVREVEGLPKDYTSKRAALADAEKELSQRTSEVRELESAVAAKQEELARAEDDLRNSKKLLATNDALKELISTFSQFHTAYVTAQLRVASAGAPAEFREILLELESKMEAMRLEVRAAAARSA